jgi:hypothetical protein
MGMMQAIRCKAGHHEWGPILGDIDHAHHKCEHCGTVKPIKVWPPRRDPGGSGMTGPGGSDGRADGAGFDSGP